MEDAAAAPVVQAVENGRSGTPPRSLNLASMAETATATAIPRDAVRDDDATAAGAFPIRSTPVK